MIDAVKSLSRNKTLIDEYSVVSESSFVAVSSISFMLCEEAIKLAKAVINASKNDIENFKNEASVSDANRLISEVYSFYDRYVSAISRGYHKDDPYESFAKMQEKTIEIISPIIAETNDVIFNEFVSDFRPLSPKIATSVIKVVFLSGMFADNRRSFSSALSKYNDLFNSFKIRDRLFSLIKNMHLHNRDGKEYLFILNRNILTDWNQNKHKRKFHGKFTSELMPVNVYHWTCKRVIDEITYKFYKVLYSTKVIDEIYAAGHGSDINITHDIYDNGYIVGCIEDYDQFCFYNSFCSLDFLDARKHLVELMKKHEKPVIKYIKKNDNTYFGSIYLDIDSAVADNNESKSDILKSIDYNKKLENTTLNICMTGNKAWISGNVMLEYVDSIAKKYGGGAMTTVDVDDYYNNKKHLI